MLRGAPGRMASKLGVMELDEDLVLYREHLLEVADMVSTRCLGEAEANQRVALRLLLGGVEPERIEALVRKGAKAAALALTELRHVCEPGKPEQEPELKHLPREFEKEARIALKLAQEEAQGLGVDPELKAFTQELERSRATDKAPQVQRSAPAKNLPMPGRGPGRIGGAANSAEQQTQEPRRKQEPILHPPVEDTWHGDNDEVEAEKTKKKKKAALEREQWLRAREREILEDRVAPVLGAQREAELITWQEGKGPEPDWHKQLKAEWTRVEGTEAGTIRGLSHAAAGRELRELGIHLDRLHYARSLCDDPDPDPYYTKQRLKKCQDWIEGKIAMPGFLQPLLSYQAQPRSVVVPVRDPMLPIDSVEAMQNRMAATAFADHKNEAEALWSALLRSAQVQHGIITQTAALVVQASKALAEGLLELDGPPAATKEQ